MPRFQPGKSGNPRGRRPGAKNKATLIMEELFDTHGENLTKKLFHQGFKGDVQAMRIIFDRLMPVRKDQPISLDLPQIDTPADLTRATGALLEGVASGQITPSQAAELAKIIDIHMKAIEVVHSEATVAELEAELAILKADRDAGEQ
ncbi:DUF5681 domain-containing protein [Methylobacterium radiotolerans]|uniref:DUF5681 domain-containing protein n=1 Tax=Methylobacterium radiotolerans TaxID=31998 RepID=UPI000976A85E|nr:DUF5681 domain-containing protein [Methylobacterium radiotolerans]ONF46470.1 hypothetical protein RSM1_24550 [Methylobacterium radiotolerans]